MTHRTTEKDLTGAVERLNRNISNFCKDFSTQIIHEYEWTELFDNNGQGLSFGNKKTELYWQVQLCNKILEQIKKVNQN